MSRIFGWERRVDLGCFSTGVWLWEGGQNRWQSVMGVEVEEGDAHCL